MAILRRQPATDPQVNRILPTGTLLQLKAAQIRPSPNNPRRLFDPGPLQSLKESIREHGVLVPLTVFRLPGQDMYGIVDGERRFKCCADLAAEGLTLTIPANIVSVPQPMASLIYMFNIHQFREQWELMPTARALKTVIEQLGDPDKEELHQVTGLSMPQVDRCLKILTFPDRFQEMSLVESPTERIPSNFWVELHPVLGKVQQELPKLIEEIGRDGVTDRLVAKYRGKKIKSVIHFRRILEAFDVAERTEETNAVADRLQEYINNPALETRAAFDEFIHDNRRFQQAAEAADRFIRDVNRAKITHVVDGKDELIEKLRYVISFLQGTISTLEGSDPPEPAEDEDEP